MVEPSARAREPELVALVDGDPQPQGNHRVSRQGRIYEAQSARLRAWRQVVGYHALIARRHAGWTDPTIAPVAVDLVFRRRPPKRHVRDHPTTRPDVDKLARAVLDALTGVLYFDDSQVVDLRARKVYAPRPGVTIRVSERSE